LVCYTHCWKWYIGSGDSRWWFADNFELQMELHKPEVRGKLKALERDVPGHIGREKQNSA
jgi:hypothetical protein